MYKKIEFLLAKKNNAILFSVLIFLTIYIMEKPKLRINMSSEKPKLKINMPTRSESAKATGTTAEKVDTIISDVPSSKLKINMGSEKPRLKINMPVSSESSKMKETTSSKLKSNMKRGESNSRDSFESTESDNDILLFPLDLLSDIELTNVVADHGELDNAVTEIGNLVEEIKKVKSDTSYY